MDNSNINELDSYGVWVKPSNNTNSQIPDEQNADTSDLSFDDLSNLVEEDDTADKSFAQEAESIETADTLGFEDKSTATDEVPLTTDTEESQLGDFEVPETSNDSFMDNTDETFDPFETPSDDIFAIDDSMTGDPIVEEETEFEEQVNPYEDAFKDLTDITDDEDVSLTGTNISESEDTVFEEKNNESPAQEAVAEANDSHIVENNSAEADILKQIVSELANLKSEISSLKENFNDLRQKSEEAAIAQKTEEPPVDTGGFFTDDDGDETISLSGDELSNIMNSVDMSQAEVVDMSDTESQLENDAFGADPIITEDSFGITDESTASEDVFSTQEDSIDSDDTFEIPEDKIIDDEFDINDDTSDDSVFAEGSDATEYISDMPEDNAEFDSVDFSSDLSSSENTDFISDELPDEISIPKIDDIVVGSSDEDFMDSVKDSEDAQERFGLMAEIPEELPYDTLEGDTLGESVEEIEEELNSLEQPDGEFESLQNVDEIMTADPEIQESITDSHIDYLKTDENKESEAPNILYDSDEPETEEESGSDAPRTFVNDLLETRDQDSEIPNSLKNEIKSVLLYMDQLLENLPEEKIVEFAQSEQFNTYKKLFAELGLS